MDDLIQSMGARNRLWGSLVTNESLEAIVSGLNPQSEDFVLSICGAGDQAFALLERAGEITIVDEIPWQIKYFLRRKSLLESGEFEMFLNPGQRPRDNDDSEDLRFRNEYFSEERLEKIKRKLKDSWRIKEKTGDIFKIKFAKGEFNKIYLSNALSPYYPGTEGVEFIKESLQRTAKWLSDGGLIYISDYKQTIEKAIHDGYADDENSFLNPLGLGINHNLTANAQILQSKLKHWEDYWKPAVLQRK
jgi:hypothetical protein